MKKYLSFIAVGFFLFLSSCTKDMFWSPERRIVGTWELAEITKIGIGSREVIFDRGVFTFYEDGNLEYVLNSREKYFGKWKMNSRYIDDYDGGSERVSSLSVTVTDSNNRVMLTELFDDVYFMSSRRFRAEINGNSYTYYYDFYKINDGMYR